MQFAMNNQAGWRINPKPSDWPCLSLPEKETMQYRKKRKSNSGKQANTQRVTLISRRAKKIRKKNEAWTKAIQRASRELKKEGKL